MSFSIGGSKNKSSSQSSQRSNSLGWNSSGPIGFVRPHLFNLYNQAGMAYEQGYSPYQGAWHTGINAPMMHSMGQAFMPNNFEGANTALLNTATMPPPGQAGIGFSVQRPDIGKYRSSVMRPDMPPPGQAGIGFSVQRPDIGKYRLPPPGQAGIGFSLQPSYQQPGIPQGGYKGVPSYMNPGVAPTHGSLTDKALDAYMPQYGGVGFRDTSIRPWMQQSARWQDPRRKSDSSGLNQFQRGTNFLGGLAAGGYNPALERSIGRAQDNLIDRFGDVKKDINAQFTRSGRTGSPAHARSVGTAASDLYSALGDVDINARMGAYEADQNRRLQAAQSLGQLGLSRHEGAEGRNLQEYGIDRNALAGRYATDVGRDLGRYSTDAGLYATARNADNARYGIDVNSMDSKYAQDMGFLGRRLASADQRYGIDKQYELGMAGLGQSGEDARLRYNLGMAGVNQSRYDARLRYNLGMAGIGQSADDARLRYNLGMAGIDHSMYDSDLRHQLGMAGINQQGDDARLRYNLGMYDSDLRHQLGMAGIDHSMYDSELRHQLGMAGINQQGDAARMRYQLGAMGLIPQYRMQDLRDRESLFNMGLTARGIDQQGLDLARQQHDYLQFAPWTWLNQYANILHQAPNTSQGYNRSSSSGSTRSTGSGKNANFGISGLQL